MSLPASNTVVSAAAGAGTLTVVADQAWTVTSSDSWLTVAVSGGTGNQTIRFNYSANGGGVARMATIRVAGEPFTVTQATSNGVYTPWGNQAVGNIWTIAGNGLYGYARDGEDAKLAWLNYPSGVAVDDNGNLYISDRANHRIRRVSGATGIITTFAGTGTQGDSGDGGAALAAAINGPAGVALDRAGNLYFADSYNHRIRKVAAGTGVITTVAGVGVRGNGGDGGPATAAQLNTPYGIAIDGSGSLYIADQYNGRIRKVEASTGVIRTIAGTGIFGYGGDGGPATQAQLSGPAAVAVGRNGDVYIADTFNYRIRKLDAQTGLLSTVAGNGSSSSPNTENLGLLMAIGDVNSLALDAEGNLYFTEEFYGRIRVLRKQTGVVSTIAGTGSGGFSGDDGPASQARLFTPGGIALDGAGNIYVADTWSTRVRFIRTVGPSVSFAAPSALFAAAAGAGSVDIGVSPADLVWTATSSATWLTLVATGGTGAGRIGFNFSANPGFGARSATIKVNGNVYTVRQGGATVTLTSSTAAVGYGSGNGSFGVTVAPAVAWTAESTAPWLTVTTGSGTVQYRYTANPLAVGRRATIVVGGRRFTVTQAAVNGSLSPWGTLSTGIIRTIAGTGTGGFSGDNGPATQAQLDFLSAVAVDGNANVYLADTGNHRVRKVDAQTGVITTVAGTGIAGSTVRATAITSELSSPQGVAADAFGNLIIADSGNNRILRVDSLTGAISTIAGTGVFGYGGDGGPATQGTLNAPRSVALDDWGNVYIGDFFNHRVRRIDGVSGEISTVLGNGVRGFGGDGVAAENSATAIPSGLFIDRDGNLLAADGENCRVRRVDAATGMASTVAGTGVAGSSGDGGAATLANVCALGVAGDGGGNLYLGSAVSDRVRKVSGGTGIIETLAGTGVSGFSGDGGVATGAQFYSPSWVALDGAGGLYIADVNNRRIRFVDYSTAPISIPQPPQLVSAAPAISSRATETFAVTARDMSGRGLQRIYFLVAGSPAITADSCHGYYDRASNTISLYNDSLSATPGPIVPGVPGTLQNSQCSVDGAFSAATSSGSDLQLVLQVSRKGSYATGVRQFYVWVVDNAGEGTGWLSASTWTITAVIPQPPVLVAYGPATVTVGTQTFTMMARDPDGVADLERVYFLVAGSTTVTTGSCHGFYERGSNSIFLYNDALTGLSAGLVPGTGGTVQNSQCAISGGSSSVTASGTDLLLNLNIKRQGSYVQGALQLYVWVTDKGGLGTGWVTVTSTWAGTEGIPLPPWVAASGPATSGALTERFTVTGRDANGATDLARIYFVINGTGDVTAGSCHGFYDRPTNGLYLYNDAFTVLSGPLTVGTSGTLQNSICAVQGATAVVTTTSTDLTLEVDVTRQGALATGNRKMYFLVADRQGGVSGWLAATVWNIAGAQPPVLAAATPPSANAVTQTFSITARDANGASDIQRIYFLLNPSSNIGTNTCHGFYDRPTNLIYLYNETLTALSAGVIPGGGGAENANCGVSGVGSSVSVSGTDLQLNLNVTRRGGYSSGLQNLYVWITDSSNTGTGWVQASTWTLGGVNQSPILAAANPTTAAVATQSFVLTARDMNGVTDISRVYFVVAGSATVGVNGCHGFYDRGSDRFYLYNNSLTGFAYPVVAGTEGNSQCSLNGAQSSATGSGTDLQVTLALTRQGAYATGALNLYAWVTDTTGSGTGWVLASAWTIPGVNVAPTLAAATPGSTSVATQSFALRARDGNGVQDVSRVYFLIGDSSTVSVNGCHGFYDRASNSIYLYDNGLTSLSAPLGMGAARIEQNSQCAVSGALSSAVQAGTDLDLTVQLTRQGSFASGTKKLYVWITDAAGAGTGWVQASSWTL